MQRNAKHRTYSAVGLTLAAMLSVNACTGDGDDGSSSSAITIWDTGYFPDQTKESLDAIDEQFKKDHPGVTIDHIGVPYNSYSTKFRAAIAAGEGPDVVTVFPGIFAADYAPGLQDLSDIVTSEMESDVQLLDISKAPDGNLYALPWTTYGFVYFYNTDMFEAAGIAEIPETWDELLATCGRLRDAGFQPISSGWKDGYLLDWFHYIFLDMLLSDDELADLSAADMSLNNDKMNDSLSLVSDMNQAECFADNGNDRQIVDFQDQFKQKKAAIILDVGLPSTLRTYAQALGGKDKVGVFLPPMVPGSEQTGPLMDMGPNGGFGVTTWSDNSDLAKEYVSYLVSAEAEQTVWDVNHLLANNTQVKMTSDWPTEQALLDLYKLPNNRTSYLALPASVMTEMEKRASSFMDGDTSAEEITDAMESAMARVRPKLQQ
jgi:ABC-type glycerol-3-phosphate transport system substrate-binding protein